MNSKITFLELVDLMATATKSSKRVCELFLRELFSTISQALIDGETVKVKGIGTFKVSQVKARNSVDVSSGEAVEISGHNKLSFTPDKSLAEAVNQPFAQFETIFLDDAVTDEKLAELDKQYPSLFPEEEVAKEASDALADKDDENATEAPARGPIMGKPVWGTGPVMGKPIDRPEPAPEPEQPEAEAEIEEAEPSQPAPEKLMAKPIPKPTPEPEPVVESEPEPTPEPVVEQEPEPEEEPAPAEQPEDKPAPEPQPEAKSEETPQPEEKPIEEPAPAKAEEPKEKPASEPEEDPYIPNDGFLRLEPRNAYSPTEDQLDELAKPKRKTWLWALLAALVVGGLAWFFMRDSGKNEKLDEVVAAVTQADTVAVVEEDKSVITDTITTKVVLTTLADRYYDSQWFWVYIYEENKDKLKDPNNVVPGTVVVIPPAEKYGIDANDPASLKKAQYRSWELLK